MKLPLDIIEHIATHAETRTDYLNISSLNKALRSRLYAPVAFKNFLLCYYGEMDFVMRFISKNLHIPLIYETFHTILAIRPLMHLSQFDEILLRAYIRDEHYNSGKLEFLLALGKHNEESSLLREYMNLAVCEGIRMNADNIVRTLIECKLADIENLGEHWNHMVTSNNYEIFEFLLKQGAKMSGDPTISTIILLDNDPDVTSTRVLLTHFRDTLSENEFTAILQSVWTVCANSQKHKASKLLLDEFDLTPQANGNIALFLAVRNNDLSLLKILFDYGLTIDDFNGDAPYYALIAVTNSVEILEMLIDYGADVNEHHGMPARFAIREGKLDTLKMLLRKGAIITSDAWKDAISVRHIHPDVYQIVREVVMDTFLDE